MHFHRVGGWMNPDGVHEIWRIRLMVGQTRSTGGRT